LSPVEPTKKNNKKITMEVKNAIITNAVMQVGDKGILTAFINLYDGNSSERFGGYPLYIPKSFPQHNTATNYAGHFIHRMMTVGGVQEWSGLIGKAVRVESENNKIIGIGHIVEDNWFYQDQEFEELRKDQKIKKD